MSAARDKFKCYALDLSLLAVTEKKTFAKRKGLGMAHPNGFVVSKASVIAIYAKSKVERCI